MTTVEAIKRQIETLSINELIEFRDWFVEFDADAWGKQIEADAASGKLNALAEEALSEYKTSSGKEIDVIEKTSGAWERPEIPQESISTARFALNKSMDRHRQ